MNSFSTFSDLIAVAEQQQKSVADMMVDYEVQKQQMNKEQVWQGMDGCLTVMMEAVQKGKNSREKSVSGMVGGNAARFGDYMKGSGILGPTAQKAMCYALAVSEVNAAMGRIVASPTAGSCGILPGAILAAGEALSCTREQLVAGLFTAAGVGLVINEHASLAGALGGCQAECGSAAAMAAAAVVEMAGGTPRQAGQALALAFKNLLGLVCDPVAGLVEVPCVKRNAFGAVHALVAAEMALSGIESVIPPDEVITASYEIGCLLPKSLRETSEAGLAKTPTGQAIEAKLHGQNSL
ncbi:L-serine dehydratase [Sporomusaceae bacterium BoRhaA]|uniref:L-serine ammonia-lyase, iron-sulfur-dependent, subunit alpha n=1 Tax=Pelorhabdus rhamnosifermentans TaxID=2772457 RepID=UPI001C0628DC|nr:L-serine ammonia-lyase, iron-sulfur-dependent, subunit alpha [Pelorhabdus rhamnosifermentans]MBU2702644.1 L-serine dehydratase [Pelorhabdus rhamnosifermentans]